MVSRSSEIARVESGQTRSLDQRGDVVLVLEARHRVVRLLLQQGARDAPRFLRLEQRQPAAMDRLWTKAEMNTVLPARDRPVTPSRSDGENSPAARPASVSRAISASSVKVVRDANRKRSWPASALRAI